MAAVAPSSSSPVFTLLNKRLRALRKKLNRISQMEESLSLGKSLNKEQLQTLRSKSVVLAGIDELERLRQPLMQAVNQEIEIALEANKRASETPLEKSTSEEEDAEGVVIEEKTAVDSAVSDLLNVVYFGSIFYVGTLLTVHDNMLTKMHERNCSLTYDYVTDDEAAGDPLKERDLDMIAMMGGMLISRPGNSSLSHKDSLQMCVEHAKLWLANSDKPIGLDSNITYAGLRQRLNKIMASDYFTTTPEIKTPVEVAAAMGNYTSFQVPLHDYMIPPVGFTVSLEDSTAEFEQEEEEMQNCDDSGMYNGETAVTKEFIRRGRSDIRTCAAIAETPTII